MDLLAIQDRNLFHKSEFSEGTGWHAHNIPYIKVKLYTALDFT